MVNSHPYPKETNPPVKLETDHAEKIPDRRNYVQRCIIEIVWLVE